MQKCGNYWCRIGTSQTVDSSLTNRASTNIVPIGTSSITYWDKKDCTNGWSQSSAITGLYYVDATISNCSSSGGKYYSSCKNVKVIWSVANLDCINRNMRIPTDSEITLYNLYCNNNHSWSSRLGAVYYWSYSNSGSTSIKEEAGYYCIK